MSIWGKMQCAYYTYKLSKTVNRCRSELDTHCGKNASLMECAEHLSNKGQTGFSHNQMSCIQKYNPTYLKKTLETCGGASIWDAFKIKGK